MGTLWAAAFAAETWTMIARPGARRFEPLTTTYENLHCALAFTTRQRALQFADAEGLRTEPGSDAPTAELLSLPVPAAVDLLDELRSVGVQCVLLNEASGPFLAPLDQLVKLFAYHGISSPVA